MTLSRWCAQVVAATMLLGACTGSDGVPGLGALGTDGPGDVAPIRADLLGHDPAVELAPGGCVTSLRVQAGGGDEAGPRWLATFALAEVPDGSLAAIVGKEDCAALMRSALADVIDRLGAVDHDAIDVTWLDPDGRRWLDP